MQIETYECSVCGKKAYLGTDEDYFVRWYHACLNGVTFMSMESFTTDEDAVEDWGLYCTTMKHAMDFDCTDCFKEGYDVGYKDCKKEQLT